MCSYVSKFASTFSHFSSSPKCILSNDTKTRFPFPDVNIKTNTEPVETLLLKEESCSEIDNFLLENIFDDIDEQCMRPTRLPSLGMEDRKKYGAPRKGSIEWRQVPAEALYSLFKAESPRQWTVLTLNQPTDFTPGSEASMDLDLTPPALPLMYPMKNISPLEALRSSQYVTTPPPSPSLEDVTDILIRSQEQIFRTDICCACRVSTVDCVLIRCGHMCLCFGCAEEQWVGCGMGVCPICRNPIQSIQKLNVSPVTPPSC